MNDLNFRIKETGKTLETFPQNCLHTTFLIFPLKPFKPSPICCKGNISVS